MYTAQISMLVFKIQLGLKWTWAILIVAFEVFLDLTQKLKNFKLWWQSNKKESRRNQLKKRRHPMFLTQLNQSTKSWSKAQCSKSTRQKRKSKKCLTTTKTTSQNMKLSDTLTSKYSKISRKTAEKSLMSLLVRPKATSWMRSQSEARNTRMRKLGLSKNFLILRNWTSQVTGKKP